MQIAVVIPALDEADRIQSTIRSAMAPGVEVLVVDGGSRDATRARASEAGARVIQSQPGRARQLAVGVGAVDAEAVVFLHGDTRLPPGWSDAVRRALADPEVAGGAFSLRFARGELRGASPAARGALRLVEGVARLRSRWLRLPYGDQALFARSRALAAAGGVPQAPLMEDLDLVRGLRRVGRLALLREEATTSPRRHLRRGVLRTAARNALALAAFALGLDRERVRRWYER